MSLVDVGVHLWMIQKLQDFNKSKPGKPSLGSHFWQIYVAAYAVKWLTRILLAGAREYHVQFFSNQPEGGVGSSSRSENYKGHKRMRNYWLKRPDKPAITLKSRR